MKFTDSLGREWFVRIDVNALRRIRDGMGINIGDWSIAGNVLKQLIIDDLFVAELACCILSPEIANRKVEGRQMTNADFFSGIATDAIERAHEAIKEALIESFRSAVVRTAVREIEKSMAGIRQNLLTSLLKPSGSESANSPGSSESTPAPSPSQS